MNSLRISISDKLLFIIKNRFKSNNDLVIEELNKLDDYYKTIGENISERTVAAIIKCSENDLKKFMQIINITKNDWRDVLISAKFHNNVNVHKTWILENYEFDIKK